MAQRIYFLLGSNEGDRQGFLRNAAVALLRELAGSAPQYSAVYETAAWGLEDQPAFLNQAISMNTAVSPEAALDAIRRVEAAAGRQRRMRWGQRTLDVDILLFGDIVRRDPELQIPHPRLPDRRFALVPLAEIAPGLVHPTLKQPIAGLLEHCPDPLPVKRFADGPVSDPESL